MTVVYYHDELEFKNALEQGRYALDEAAIYWWCRKDYWTTQEAIAISLNHNPYYIDWALLEQLAGKCDLADKYLMLWNLVCRSDISQIRPDTNPRQVTPQEVIDWIESKKLSFPPKMLKAVEEIAAVESRKTLKLRLAEKDREINRLNNDITKLQSENKVLQDSQKDFAPQRKPSFYKVVFGLAVAYCEYDPNAKNGAVAQILDDLAVCGIDDINETTVRGVLSESAKGLGKKEH